jgi:hypothetical protein
MESRIVGPFTAGETRPRGGGGGRDAQEFRNDPGLHLTGEFDKRCCAGASGEQAFGAKTAAQRAWGWVFAWVPTAEEPSLGMPHGCVDEVDYRIREDFGEFDRKLALARLAVERLSGRLRGKLRLSVRT